VSTVPLAIRVGRSTTRPRRGISIVELLVATLLFTVVMTATSRTLLRTHRDLNRQRSNVRADEALIQASVLIGNVLRNSGADPLGTAPDVLDPNPMAANAFNNLRVAADFNPADGDVQDPLEDVQIVVRSDSLRVRWQQNGLERAVVHPIRSIAFVYQSATGQVLTSATGIRDSTARVQVTVVAPTGPDAHQHRWTRFVVSMRNRR
jgi:type II secretory pathway component PulJ